MTDTLTIKLEEVKRKLSKKKFYSAAQLSVFRKQRYRLNKQLSEYKKKLKQAFNQTHQLSIKL